MQNMNSQQTEAIQKTADQLSKTIWVTKRKKKVTLWMSDTADNEDFEAIPRKERAHIVFIATPKAS